MIQSFSVRRKRFSFSGKKTLASFMQVNIDFLKESGKYRTSETYKSTLSSFMKFTNGKDIQLSAMDGEMMMNYQNYLRATGVTMNTVSFYMRILRATYNRAVDNGVVVRSRLPFKRVYTGVEKTVKRAIPPKILKSMKEMKLNHSTSMEFSRDIFLFSFYTRGMSFVDIAFLKKSDLHDGLLTYRRKKTGKLLTIKWEPCMQGIVDKYSHKFSDYLFPIIVSDKKSERLQYKTTLCRVNRCLKVLGQRMELPHPLTMYCARHSWASAAKGKHIPVSVISEGMGHDSERTTLIYLAALDTSVLDRANKMILRELM